MIALLQAECHADGSGAELMPAGELQKIVAPVALYPDSLLAHLLPASTLPGEIAEAAAFLKAKGGKIAGLPDSDWDPSIKALLRFPVVLKRLNDDPTWTKKLGAAVSSQRQELLGALQSIRQKALSSGSLKTCPFESVITSGSIISLVSPDPRVIHVPAYDPAGLLAGGRMQLPTYSAAISVADWWHYRSLDWVNHAIVVKPVYHAYFNYRPGARYYNPPGIGYPGMVIWHPAALAGADYQARTRSEGTTSLYTASPAPVMTKKAMNIGSYDTDNMLKGFAPGGPAEPAIPATRGGSAMSGGTAPASSPSLSLPSAGASRPAGIFDRLESGGTDRSYSERGSFSRGSGAPGGRR